MTTPPGCGLAHHLLDHVDYGGAVEVFQVVTLACRLLSLQLTVQVCWGEPYTQLDRAPGQFVMLMTHYKAYKTCTTLGVAAERR